jgi:hypothetical protein
VGLREGESGAVADCGVDTTVGIAAIDTLNSGCGIEFVHCYLRFYYKLFFIIESAKIHILVETAKFFYPQHQNQPQTNRQRTLLTDVKTQVFYPGFTPQKPTMVGVGREMVGSWQGVKRELAAIEVRANIYFFCLRMEKVSYLCILN